MTYTVSSGTLNLTQLLNSTHTLVASSSCVVVSHMWAINNTEGFSLCAHLSKCYLHQAQLIALTND